MVMMMGDKIFNMDKKIAVIFILLYLSNIVLWIFLLYYNPYNSTFNYDFNDLKYYFTIASVLILFGYISSRLPKLRSLGDSSLYEIGYLLIMGILGLTVSYFNSVINDSFVIEPFIQMFNVLAIVLIIMIFATRLRSFKAIIHHESTQKDIVVCLIAFLILGALSTIVTSNLGHSSANVRTMTIMIAGLFGGPMVGIPTAILAGALRLSIGGTAAVPCALSTVICGFIASAIHIWNGNRFLKTVQSAILMFLFMGFEMLLIFLMVPQSVAVHIILEIYAPMTFVAVIGIILFKLVIAETREKAEDDSVDMETEIENLKSSLKEHEEKIKLLEEEIKNKSDLE